MHRPRFLALSVLALGAAAGCSDHEFHPPAEEDRVAEAEAQYDAARFDTLTWASDSVRLEAGNLVYATECRRCHGPLGQGDTDYVRRNDLEIPSLVEPDWEFADDLEGVHRRIFVGHVGGMPNWGVGKLSERQIDAVSYYLLEQLRPEVAGQDGDAEVPDSATDEAGDTD